jgi:type I restriction enzyme S subunit
VLVGELQEKTTHSGFTIRARLRTDEILPTYLCHFLKSGAVRRELIDGGNGANIKSLNQGGLSALTVPFPSLVEQADNVLKLEAVRDETQHLESLYTRKLAALDELKQSLLQQAFSGQL